MKLVKKMIGYKKCELFLAEIGVNKEKEVYVSPELLELTHNKMLSLVKRTEMIKDNKVIIVRKANKEGYINKYQDIESFEYYDEFGSCLVDDYAKVVKIICPLYSPNISGRLKYKDIQNEREKQKQKILSYK